MIREILEQKGIEVETHFRMVRGNHTEEVIINGGDKRKYIINKSQTQSDVIEQACRQYVKENGFKLEWLNEYDEIVNNCFKNLIKWQKGLLQKSELPIFLYIHNDTIWKVYAWLYANDIEIKE